MSTGDILGTNIDDKYKTVMNSVRMLQYVKIEPLVKGVLSSKFISKTETAPFSLQTSQTIQEEGSRVTFTRRHNPHKKK